jgi:hypothetical protein
MNLSQRGPRLIDASITRAKAFDGHVRAALGDFKIPDPGLSDARTGALIR